MFASVLLRKKEIVTNQYAPAHFSPVYHFEMADKQTWTQTFFEK